VVKIFKLEFKILTYDLFSSKSHATEMESAENNRVETFLGFISVNNYASKRGCTQKKQFVFLVDAVIYYLKNFSLPYCASKV